MIGLMLGAAIVGINTVGLIKESYENGINKNRFQMDDGLTYLDSRCRLRLKSNNHIVDYHTVSMLDVSQYPYSQVGDKILIELEGRRYGKLVKNFTLEKRVKAQQESNEKRKDKSTLIYVRNNPNKPFTYTIQHEGQLKWVQVNAKVIYIDKETGIGMVAMRDEHSMRFHNNYPDESWFPEFYANILTGEYVRLTDEFLEKYGEWKGRMDFIEEYKKKQEANIEKYGYPILDSGYPSIFYYPDDLISF